MPQSAHYCFWNGKLRLQRLSAGFRIKLLSTEDRRYLNITSLVSYCQTEIKSDLVYARKLEIQ